MGHNSPTFTGRPMISTASETSLAPGFRFHPTDEELVWYYLRRKVCGKPFFHFDAISETDIYKCEPWDLPEKSRLKTRDQEWYFFSALDKKYGNGVRMNRATNKGYWKTTGKDRVVRHKLCVVGMKKTLVFHSGRAPGGERTNWVMHEYRLADEESEKIGVPLDAFVLCRVFQKSGLGPPTGDRYAPFVEEEWDTDTTILVPGDDTGGDDEVVDNVLRVEGIDLERDAGEFLKRERSEDGPEPFPVIQKRRITVHEEEEGGGGGFSLEIGPTVTTTTQDCGSSSTATTDDVAVAAAHVSASSRPPLLEYPLLESFERRGAPQVSATLAAFLPPAYLTLFGDLQNEIHSVSAEKAAMKIELLSAQAVIQLLHSRIEFLSRGSPAAPTPPPPPPPPMCCMGGGGGGAGSGAALRRGV